MIRLGAFRIALTIALPALALLIGQILRPWLEPTFDPLFIAATAATTLYCGAAYGAACLALSALCLNYFFQPPFNTLQLQDSGHYLKFALFLASGALIILLIHFAQKARAEQKVSEMRYRSLAELIPFGGWIADYRGDMIQLSESFLKTLNVTMAECRGSGWARLLDEADRERVLAAWSDCVRNGYFWDCEYRLVGSTGRHYTVLSRGVLVPGRTRKEQTWVGIQLDITDRERSIEERVRQARDLARFNAELEQLAYVSAHDLQEPLRMIASYLQLLSRRYKGKLDSEADTFIAYAVEGAERLKALLQDLLELQQVGKGNRPRAIEPLTKAAVQARDSLAAEIRQAGASITIEDLPTLEHEERAMVQVFAHLLGNAIKYRREGIAPKIEISAERKQEQFWQIQIRDNGIGIPIEYAGKVFDIFQRLHPRSEYPGTGIGLAICKKIVEAHGGKIHLESIPDEGSRFYLTLPVNRTQGA